MSALISRLEYVGSNIGTRFGIEMFTLSSEYAALKLHYLLDLRFLPIFLDEYILWIGIMYIEFE